MFRVASLSVSPPSLFLCLRTSYSRMAVKIGNGDDTYRRYIIFTGTRVDCRAAQTSWLFLSTTECTLTYSNPNLSYIVVTCRNRNKKQCYSSMAGAGGRRAVRYVTSPHCCVRESTRWSKTIVLSSCNLIVTLKNKIKLVGRSSPYCEDT